MLPVSVDYLNSIKAERRRFHAKVEITWTDPRLDQSIRVTTNERGYTSWPAHAANGMEAPAYKYASLDGSWVLDGSYHLAPGTQEEADLNEMGWWGQSIAGVGGTFAVPYPKLIVTFLPRPVLSLKVVGDAKRAEYPVDFVIRIYNASGALLRTETVVGNTNVAWQRGVSEFNLTDVTRVELEITKWSLAGRTVKITEFFTAIQETYDDDDILFLSLLEERDQDNGSLPIGNISANEIDVRLENSSGRFTAGNTASPLYGLVKRNRKIRAWIGIELPDGLIEFQPLGVFWSTDWDVQEEAIQATTSARDRMESLAKSTFSTSQVYQNVTLYNLAITVLQDADLRADEYWIDTELQQYAIPYAWFEPVSHREALRMIVEACLGQAYCDRNGVVRVEGPSFIKLP